MNSENLYNQVYTFDDQDSATTGEQELSFDKYKEWGDKVLGAMKATEATKATEVSEAAETAESKVNKQSFFAKLPVKKLVAGAIAAVTVTALTACGAKPAKSQPAEAPADPQTTNTEQAPTLDPNKIQNTVESLTGSEVLDGLIDGTFEQYNNPGGHDRTWAKDPSLRTQGRPDIYSATSVANVADILQYMIENDLIEDRDNIKDEEWGMAYKFVAFSQKEPAAYMAISAKVPGFENLSYEQAVSKIASMDESERTAFQYQLGDVFSRTTFTHDVVEGGFESYYIGEQNGEKRGFIDNIKLEKPTGILIMNVATKSLAEGDKAFVMSDDGTYVPPSALATETKDDDGDTTVIRILKRCFNGGKHVTFIERKTGTKTNIEVRIDTPPVQQVIQENDISGVTEDPVKKQDPVKENPVKPEKPAEEKKESTGHSAGGDGYRDVERTVERIIERTIIEKPVEEKKQEEEKKKEEEKKQEEQKPTPAPKNEVAEAKNAPVDVTPLTVDKKEVTTKEQDKIEYENIRRQQQADIEREIAAERERQSKLEREREAALEAEKRQREAEEKERQRQEEIARKQAELEAKRQAAAEEAERQRLAEEQRRIAEEERIRQEQEAEAKRKADEEAAALKAAEKARHEAEAAAERQRQAEEAARRRAEEEAIRLAEQQRQEAERNANTATVNENANLFNNFDF